ncbi:hypothetical protein LMG7974_00258 [Campylobacter majalis]|uniref:HMA domain-containing protein n=1 Tax=Campylobacter majalis TaxID=2790656 RepID=A0ABM8Q3M6_9BACT|nr:heavy metal-associated domain-containing protein [Campylobacter majalis]CAD7287362.1 hypothetical protein LMG7974_00258 [Campylobacter majalis]
MNKIILLSMFCIFAFAKETIIVLDSMHCPLCTAMVRKSLLEVDGVKSVKVSLKTKQAVVDAKDDVSDKVLLKACKAVGYLGVIKNERN